MLKALTAFSEDLVLVSNFWFLRVPGRLEMTINTHTFKHSKWHILFKNYLKSVIGQDPTIS